MEFTRTDAAQNYCYVNMLRPFRIACLNYGLELKESSIFSDFLIARIRCKAQFSTWHIDCIFYDNWCPGQQMKTHKGIFFASIVASPVSKGVPKTMLVKSNLFPQIFAIY